MRSRHPETGSAAQAPRPGSSCPAAAEAKFTAPSATQSRMPMTSRSSFCLSIRKGRLPPRRATNAADAAARAHHLAARDRWVLDGVEPSCVHLMVQSMEAWIAADPNAVAAYYGQGFHANKPPSSPPTSRISRRLRIAREPGDRHARNQQRRIRQDQRTPEAARVDCPGEGRRTVSPFKTFTSWLAGKIDAA